MRTRAQLIALLCVTLVPQLCVAQSSVSSSPAPSSAPPADAVDRSDRIVHAAVVVLAGTVARARGVVIASDGRIVTALHPLGTQTSFTVRYPSGRTAGADVVASDAAWGLALLQPRTGAWPQGLTLSDAARSNAPVRWTVGNPPVSLGGHLRRRHTFVAADASLLRDAWELDPPPPDHAVGSGVANANAEIVAVIVPPDPRVTRGGSSVPFGAPASAIRDLIQRAGNTGRPWLGLVARAPRRGDTAALALNGLRVIEVAHGGPAEHAGILAGNPGDVIVGTPDHPIHSLDDLGVVLAPLHPGDTITLRVVRQGITFDLPIQLTVPQTL